MATYIEYRLQDGGTILIEADDNTNLPTKASAGADAIKEAEKMFEEALASVKSAVGAFRSQFADLETDEVEVSFTIKATGEAGVFAVCKVGAEASFNISLKWKKPSTQ